MLAISSDLEVLRRMLASLELAGATVDAARSIDAIAPGEIGHRYVVVHVRPGERAALEAVLARLRPRAHVIVVTEEASLADFTALLADPRVNNLLVGDRLERSLTTTAQKLLTGDIFGVEHYLPRGTPVHYARLRDFAGRGRAIDTVLEFAEQARMRRHARAAIGQVCEELLMNALYDAPVDAEGRPVFAEVAPTARTHVHSPRPVSLRFAATETEFAISVRDRFGRLGKHTILRYIDKCLTASDQIDRKTYGAGLGLYFVANAAASYVVNVAYGVATEVICTFDRGARTRLGLLGMFVHPHEAHRLREDVSADHVPVAPPAGSLGSASRGRGEDS